MAARFLLCPCGVETYVKLPRRPFLVALAAAVFLATVTFVRPLQPTVPPEFPILSARALAAVAEVRARAPVDSAVLERAVLARFDHAPLTKVFQRWSREPEIAGRIARAVVKEATRLDIAPSLLAGVLLTENRQLDPETVSSQGAIGLMQVMHFHAGTFDCGSEDLRQVESNICHGAQVFGYYLKRTNNVRTALLRYNGCVVGANTRNCHRYPNKVLREARKIRRQLLRSTNS